MEFSGKVVRVKRLDDRGSYKVRVIAGKPLSKADLKKALKLLEEKIRQGRAGRRRAGSS